MYSYPPASASRNQHDTRPAPAGRNSSPARLREKQKADIDNCCFRTQDIYNYETRTGIGGAKT